ncbi:MAG: DUF4145 domain-containing protein [Lachnospiraceae bacterium]|nr:DUF4145 domain-containing protein [Lachnospiraceae bacterium]
MNDQFAYLKKYSDVYDAVLEVNRRISQRDWTVSIQKMRTAAERMLKHVYQLYGEVSRDLDFCNSINQLHKAGIISQKSAGNYHRIRMIGNEAVHCNVNYSEQETRGVYGVLLEESVLFAERYMVQMDPYGRERLRRVVLDVPAPTAYSAPTREKRNNALLSEGMARGIALFELILFLVIGGAVLPQMFQCSVNTTVVGITFLLIGAGVLVSLYTLVTGDERPILIWILMGR